MANKKKILKNTTGSDREYPEIGLTVPANGQITIEPGSYYLVAEEIDVTGNLAADIRAGTIVVNDGVKDITAANGLNVERGIDYLKHPDTAFNIRFLSETERTNGFVSKNVQEAIEEVTTSGIGSGGQIFFFNDAGTEDKWLRTFDHHMQASGPFNPSPTVPNDNKDIMPFIVPHDMKIFSLTFVNKNDNASTDFEFYKNGNLIFTWQLRNSRWSVKNTGLGSLTFSPSDKISIFARKVAGAAQKPDVTSLVLYYTITKISTSNFSDSDFV